MYIVYKMKRMVKKMAILVKLRAFRTWSSVCSHCYVSLFTVVYLDLYDELQTQEEGDDHNWVPSGELVVSDFA